MPGLISHYICGQAVIDKLDEKSKRYIQAYRQIFNVGTQGPDIFFYYYPMLIRKKIKGTGSVMHKNNVGHYISQMIDIMEKLEGKENEKVTSYLCGYLTHYCFDCNAHPYIYYKTGFKKENENIKALKYSVYHRKFETAIDVILLKLLSSEKPSDKKLWKIIKVNRNDVLAVSELISNALLNTYDVKVSKRQVYRAMYHMSMITRVLQSKHGRKKRFIEFLEDRTIKERLYSSIIHLQEINDGMDYLNLSKSDWYMPWNNSKKINLTFMDLFLNAVDEGKEMIDYLFKFKNKIISRDDLLKKIGNKSLLTGIDSSKKIIFKYCDIIYEK